MLVLGLFSPCDKNCLNGENAVADHISWTFLWNLKGAGLTRQDASIDGLILAVSVVLMMYQGDIMRQKKKILFQNLKGKFSFLLERKIILLKETLKYAKYSRLYLLSQPQPYF